MVAKVNHTKATLPWQNTAICRDVKTNNQTNNQTNNKANNQDRLFS
ncbi:MAG: hypothetical protein AAFQ91_16905 [Cyanobacteria bacterium J06621_15]